MIIQILTLVFILIFTTSCASHKGKQFEVIQTNFIHKWSGDTFPFSGASVIDINNDGQAELFVGGGETQNDVLLTLKDKKYSNIIKDLGISNKKATYGSISVDMDSDGNEDLLVCRDDGLYLYMNLGSKFNVKKINLNLQKDAIPFAVTVSDIDHDNDLDIYVSIFINSRSFQSGVFNDVNHAKKNILLENIGGLNFKDITEFSNVAGKQNTFLSVFVDLDNDGWQDLVLSQNTGEIEIYKNNKDKTFTYIPIDSGYGFWMGVAVGDIDKDGDQDLFFSNAGDSIPTFLTKGDLKKNQRHNHDWLLLQNNGNFQFLDITQKVGIKSDGFSWGAVFEDLDLDGNLDLLIAQNYIKWPIHRFFKLEGKRYLQKKSHFVDVDLGLQNKFYGQSPIITDINNDNILDVVWLNNDGPIRAFINKKKGKTFVVNVKENAKTIGTKIFLVTNIGRTYTKEVITGVGLMTDQSSKLVFALQEDEIVESINLKYPDGKNEEVKFPNNNISLY